MTRNTILKQLKEDLTDKLNSNNDYNSDPSIVQGVVEFMDVHQYPTVAFYMFRDTVRAENMDDNRERTMTILIYGYAETHLNNFDNIHNLAEDVETFLYSDHWTYSDMTLLGDAEFDTADNERSRFTLLINIEYTQD